MLWPFTDKISHRENRDFPLLTNAIKSNQEYVDQTNIRKLYSKKAKFQLLGKSIYFTTEYSLNTFILNEIPRKIHQISYCLNFINCQLFCPTSRPHSHLLVFCFPTGQLVISCKNLILIFILPQAVSQNRGLFFSVLPLAE